MLVFMLGQQLLTRMKTENSAGFNEIVLPCVTEFLKTNNNIESVFNMETLLFKELTEKISQGCKNTLLI